MSNFSVLISRLRNINPTRLAIIGVPLILALVAIIHWWAIITAFVAWLILATVVAGLVGWGMSAHQVKPWSMGIAIAVISLTIMWCGCRDISFHQKYNRIEAEFAQRASGWSSDMITPNQNLDFHGELTEIINRRDQLCKDYHHPKPFWWVDTDRGVTIEHRP